MKSAATSALLTLAITLTITAATKPAPKPFNVVEASISDMQAALKDGRVTSHELVQQYLTRIATYEDKLHAAITVNPNALKEADERDRERAAGKIRGPLHGIPIALKDNIQTTDMLTTGGALAFASLLPPYDATLTKNLRDGGRHHHRQDPAHRAGQLGGRQSADADELQRPQRLRLQSLRSAARPARPSSATDGPRSPPAAPAPAPEPPPASGRQTSAARRPARSSVRRTRTCWPRSSRPSDASAATASSPSPPTRTRPARWRSSSPTRPSSSAFSRGTTPTRTIPPRRAARRLRIMTICHS